jgi:DNA-binding PadR family transcriptional regulator
MFWTMSIDGQASLEGLTPTSFVVLGLIDREGPSTPYDLKRRVAATIGHFWSFPHALLYTEPTRLVAMGLLTEARETAGRRRRVFTITDRGRQALRQWLARPAREPSQLRDAGLLQLFFADLASDEQRRALAQTQLALHRAALAGYETADRSERQGRQPAAGVRTVEQWRGATLPMGLLYERAAVAFWEGVVAAADGEGDPGGEA